MRPVYVFDIDDTLIDSAKRYEIGVLPILDEEGISYDAEETVRALAPLGVPRSAEYFCRVLGVRGSVEAVIARLENGLLRYYASDVRPRAGVINYLERLRNEGARLFVLSASPHKLVDVCLQANRMTELFEQVWTIEDFDGVTKEHPRLFEAVAARIGVLPSAVHYFDDSTVALRNAKKVGFRTYAVSAAQSKIELHELQTQHVAFIKSFEDLI